MSNLRNKLIAGGGSFLIFIFFAGFVYQNEKEKFALNQSQGISDVEYMKKMNELMIKRRDNILNSKNQAITDRNKLMLDERLNYQKSVFNQKANSGNSSVNNTQPMQPDVVVPQQNNYRLYRPVPRTRMS